LASGSKMFGQQFNYYHQVFMEMLAGNIWRSEEWLILVVNEVFWL